MNRSILVLIAFFVFSTFCFSIDSSGLNHVKNYDPLPILSFGASARAQGMMEAYTAISDGGDVSLYYNPANFVFSTKKLSFNTFVSDYFNGLATYAALTTTIKFNRFFAIGVGVKNIDYNNFTHKDEFNNNLEEISINDIVRSIGISVLVPFTNDLVSVGTVLHRVNAFTGYKADYTDFGVSFRTSFFAIGYTRKNSEPYNRNDELLTEYVFEKDTLGIAINVFNFTISMDIEENAYQYVGRLGLELRIGSRNSNFALRAGYLDALDKVYGESSRDGLGNIFRSKNIGVQDFSVGVGIKILDYFAIDISHYPGGNIKLGSTTSIGITFKIFNNK